MVDTPMEQWYHAYGTPMEHLGGRLEMEMSKFRSYYTKDENGCRLWHGPQKVRHRGRVRWPRQVIRDEMKLPPIPPGFRLRNLCGHPECITPEHWEKVSKDDPIKKYRFE